MGRATRSRSRRRFLQGGLALVGLSLLAGCGTLPTGHRGTARVARIGWLGVAGPEVAEPFRQALADLGYQEGERAILELRYAAGDIALLPAFAAELAGLPADVIVAQGTAAIRAARDASAAIPIVMAQGNSPVENGFIASLARPGGNVTGVTANFRELIGKRLELTKALLGGSPRVAVLWNPAIPDRARDLPETEEAARALGMMLRPVEARDAGQLSRALETVAADRADALVLLDNAVLDAHQEQVAAFALGRRLPLIAANRSYAVSGGLLAYGPSLEAMVRRAAVYVHKILDGAKAAELPVEQPTEFEFVINARTAKVLGLSFPESVLLQATEVLQ